MGVVCPLRWVCLLIWVAYVVSREPREIDIKKIPVVDGVPNCGTNCTYLSSYGGAWMPCLIDNCETLPAENEYVSDPPDVPRKGLSFVKYTDPQSGEESLFLSIKFSPKEFNTIIYTRGMFVHIYDGKKNYKRCYKLDRYMDYNANKNDVFHDVCFKPTQKNLTLYSSIYVTVSGLPLLRDETSTTFIIKVQNGTDDILHGNSSNISCHDSSFLYEYDVGPSYGDTASVTVCQEDINGKCKNGTKRIISNLTLIGSMNISVTSADTNFTVLLRGSNSDKILRKTYADFSVCVDDTSSSPLLPILPIMLALSVVILILLFFCLWKRMKRKKTPKTDVYREVVAEDLQIPDFPSKNIFILLKDDDYEHGIVVDVFCRILCTVYGQNAYTQFHSKEYVKNPLAHILQSMQEADKVLVICSNETKECKEEEGIFDRSVCLVRDQASLLMNTMKFMICYFDYDTPDCIPEDLAHIRHRYKLMDDFEKLFFALIEKEKYIKNGIVNFEKVQPEAPDWDALDAAVLRMKKKKHDQIIIGNPLPVNDADTSSHMQLGESQPDILNEDATSDAFGSVLDQENSELNHAENIPESGMENRDSSIRLLPNTDGDLCQTVATVPKTVYGA